MLTVLKMAQQHLSLLSIIHTLAPSHCHSHSFPPPFQAPERFTRPTPSCYPPSLITTLKPTFSCYLLGTSTAPPLIPHMAAPSCHFSWYQHCSSTPSLIQYLCGPLLSLLPVSTTGYILTPATSVEKWNHHIPSFHMNDALKEQDKFVTNAALAQFNFGGTCSVILWEGLYCIIFGKRATGLSCLVQKDEFARLYESRNCQNLFYFLCTRKKKPNWFWLWRQNGQLQHS